MSTGRRGSAQKQAGAAGAEPREAEEGVHYEFAQVSQRRENRHEITFDLILRQQPKHSRMCGVGEKGNVQRADRRPVDPPPIIQLKVNDPAVPEPEASSFLQNPYYFMYASLVMPESPEELHLLKDGRTRATTGSVVSSLHHLKDVDNADAGFFVFPDFSVRMEGTYRLKFSLFEIVGKEVIHCKYIYSEPFTVYSAKRFPGMEESTFLSRSFADQGLKIRIRKEIRIRRRFGKRKGSGQQDGEEVEPKRARPRRRGEGYDDDDDEECDASYSGESRRVSPISEIPVRSEDEARRAYDAPNSHDDPYYAADPWGSRLSPARGPFPPGGYCYPPPISSYRGIYPRQGPPCPPRRSPYPYGIPLHSYGRYPNSYPDPMADPTFAYGHPSRRPWIPGSRSEPPENVQAPSNMQMIPPPGAAIPFSAAGLSQPRSPEAQVAISGYYDDHRGPAYPPGEGSSAPSATRAAGSSSAYLPYRGYYPYSPAAWYDPYGPYYSHRPREYYDCAASPVHPAGYAAPAGAEYAHQAPLPETREDERAMMSKPETPAAEALPTLEQRRPPATAAAAHAALHPLEITPTGSGAERTVYSPPQLEPYPVGGRGALPRYLPPPPQHIYGYPPMFSPARRYGYDDGRGWRSPHMGPRSSAADWQRQPHQAGQVEWPPHLPPPQSAGCAAPPTAAPPPPPWLTRSALLAPPVTGQAAGWSEAASGRPGPAGPNGPPPPNDSPPNYGPP